MTRPNNNHFLMFAIMFLTIILLLFNCGIKIALAIPFDGIPAAFGDLDLNKRTDIVAIGNDGLRIDIYYQPPLEMGFSCKSEKQIVQVYLAEIDGSPNLLPLLLARKEPKLYELKSLKVANSPIQPNTNTAYSVATAAALNSDGANNSLAQSLPLKRDPPDCEFSDLGAEMIAQPLLFDLDGDLRTDFMSLNKDSQVTVWRPPKAGSSSERFEAMPASEWNFISKDYFAGIHSNSFIDINNDNAADIVLSGPNAKVAYLYADPDPKSSFKTMREFSLRYPDIWDYGQSTLVDINADGLIDHIIPRCKKSSRHCEIVILYDNGSQWTIFDFQNTSTSDTRYNYDYWLEKQTFAGFYEFPIMLRASDLDADGYTDFVIVAKNNKDGKNKVLYLHNIHNPKAAKDPNALGANTMTRTFEVQEISTSNNNQSPRIVTLFDINEDGKIDMLVGSASSEAQPKDLNVSAIMNTQMVDACFMKVLVTNGIVSADAGSSGQSARGPSICFELSQNDGKKLQGCAGQLSQSSHFALQSPYVIFGLGQTPHFVETLNVSIPGFNEDHKVRTRTMEQIVPDAQVIVIPRQKDNPNSWDYKMFLSPMSDMVFSTLVALAGLCLIILLIIFILHRQETLEDAAEHEEYKKHWPESR